MSATAVRWMWRAFFALFALGVSVAIWQRVEIGQLANQTVSPTMKPLPRANAIQQSPPRALPEVRAEIAAMFDPAEQRSQREFRNDSLQAMRGLRGVPTDELVADLKASGVLTQFARLALADLAARDASVALDLALEIELKMGMGFGALIYTSGLLARFAVRDPKAARRWLDGLEDSYGDRLSAPNYEMLRSSIERSTIAEEMHRDPVTALERAYGDRSKDMSVPKWREFADCVEPSDWSRFAEIAAAKNRGAKDGAEFGSSGSGEKVFEVVASSMVHHLGFDGAWIRLGELDLSPETRFQLAQYLVAAELGPATPERAAKLIKLAAEEERPRLIGRIARAWADSDGVSASAWLASFDTPQTDRALELMIRMSGRRQPRHAALMALQVRDESKRNSMLADVLDEWSSVDPLAAELFVAQLEAEAEAKGVH